jgi:hypothetical protein
MLDGYFIKLPFFNQFTQNYQYAKRRQLETSLETFGQRK